VSLSRCRSAASSGRLPLACLTGLLLAVVAVLLLPTLALALVASGEGGCLCQGSQPPGDYLGVVACLDVSHGWLSCGSALRASACGLGAVSTAALTPQGRPCTATSVGRPPPLSV
jgi:hypothetical protein